jgi:hypothetical protein
MPRARFALVLIASLSFAFAGFSPAQTVLFTENFGTSGLGTYTETDVNGIPTPTLWHGENECGPPTLMPTGATIDYLFTPSGGSYTVTQTPATFTSIAGAPGAIPIIPAGQDDLTTGPIPRFMPFTFFGAPKTWVQISTNGFVVFDQTLGGGFFTNDPIPTPGTVDDMVAPWWDDLHTGATGTVWMLITFANQVVVEWNTMEKFPFNSSGENATFQLKLNASPANTIEFHYDHASFTAGACGDPWDATVGLENATGLTGVDPTGNGNSNPFFPHAGGSTPVLSLIPPSMGANAAAYNQGDIGVYTFNTGGQNDGAIQSPVVTPSASGQPRIAFEYAREGETGMSFDQCFVEVKPVGGTTWSLVAQLTSNTGDLCCAGSTVIFGPGCASAITPGTPFQHRFRFDTVDGVANDFFGWYVDNVSVTELTGTGTFNPVLSENFEGAGLGVFVETDINGTPSPTLWHGEGSCDVGLPLPAVMQTKAAAYNQGDIGLYTFDTGSANQGAIESPAVATGPPITAVQLQFDYAKETEPSLSFDQCFVEVSPGVAGGWNMVTQLPGANVVCGGAPSHVLIGGVCDPALNSLVAAGGGKFRFYFDTVDSIGNAYRGWYVDNVVLEGASPGGTVVYGNGCAGSGGVIPVIGSTGLPQLGNLSFAVTLSSALPGTSAFLIIGVSDQTWLGFSLPLNLGFVLAPACSLLASAEILIPTATSATGTASQVTPVPIVPSLVGASLFKQWGVIDPGAAGPLPLAMSRGLKVTIF